MGMTSGGADTSVNATVVVVGGGTMGAGIAQSLLTCGGASQVVLIEQTEVALGLAVERVSAGLQRQFRKDDNGAETVQQFLQRLVPSVGFGRELNPQLVVEAVPEDFDLKQSVLIETSGLWPDALLASNTSSLSLSELAVGLPHPEQFLGMHFFNPVPVSKLIEIVTHAGTSASALERARRWVRFVEKESIEVRDSPGFATSRLGVALGLEAIRMVEDGVAAAADIDRGMVLGYRLPIGPLELTDIVGLDVRLAIADHLSRTLGPRFEPPKLLREMVASGRLGKKSGQGFFDWSGR
jgi:3-hydroxybutyryl-CoA dehydrogenase